MLAKAGRTWLRSSVAYRSAVLGRLVACLVASHRAAAVPNVIAARRRRVPRQLPGPDGGIELGSLGPGGEGAAVLDRVPIPPLDQEMAPLLTRDRRGKNPDCYRHVSLHAGQRAAACQPGTGPA